MKLWHGTLLIGGRMHESQTRQILFFIVLISTIINLIISWSPLQFLLMHIIPDDAFYYFKIANNIIIGKGASFDGIHPTNGFHPLWMLLLLPIFKLVTNKILAIHLVLTLCSLLNIIAILIFYSICKNYLSFSIRISLLLTAWYAFNPFLWLTIAGNLNGLETSICLLLVLLFILYYFKLLFNQTNNFSVFGLISGLVLLARTDNIILVALTYLFLLWHFRSESKNIFRLIFAGFICSIIFLCFLVWNYINFHQLVQISGYAIAPITKFYWHFNLVGFIFQYIKNLWNLAMSLGIPGLSKYSVEFLFFFSILILLIVFIMISYLIATNNAKNKASTQLYQLLPLILTVFIEIFVSTCRIYFPRPWYYAIPVPTLLMSLGVLLNFYFTRKKSVLFFILCIFIGVMLLISTIILIKPVINDEGIPRYQMAKKLEVLLPKNTNVGSFNAGILGYFTTKIRIINLDGLVNNSIYPYIKNKDLNNYLIQNKISYLLDDVGTMRSFSKFYGKNWPKLSITYYLPQSATDINQLKFYSVSQ